MSSLTPNHDTEACRQAGECYRNTLSNLKALLKEVDDCDRHTKTGKDKCCSDTFPPDWSVPPISYPITPQREKEYKINLKMPWERQQSQIIAGKYYMCNCVKRDGLQADCPLIGCQGSDLCLTKPYPICPPSGNASTNVTDEMAECLLSGLPPVNTSVDITECKENEPCNVKCAECNATLLNICKWNPDFFNTVGGTENSSNVPGVPVPTIDKIPSEPIRSPEVITNSKLVEPSPVRINVQVRLSNGTKKQNMTDSHNGDNNQNGIVSNLPNNQNIGVDACNRMNQNSFEDPCSKMNNQRFIDPCNGMNQNITVDPGNGMNGNKITSLCNRMDYQTNSVDPSKSLVPYNGNNTVDPCPRFNIQIMPDANNGNGKKTTDNRVRSKHVVLPSDVEGKCDKKDYYNKIVELCSKIQQLDAQCIGMNNKVADPSNGNNRPINPCSRMNQNIPNQQNTFEVCRRVDYNTPQTNGLNGSNVTDFCFTIKNQNSNQTNRMNYYNKIVDQCSGLNNGYSNGTNGYKKAEPHNGLNNDYSNGTNGCKTADPCKTLINGYLNGTNGFKTVDPSNGLNNGYLNRTNGYKTADPYNGINNGYSNGMTGFKTADPCNWVNNQNNMVVPYSAVNGQNNKGSSARKQTEPCSKMVLKFTMVDPNKAYNSNNDKTNGVNKKFDPCSGTNYNGNSSNGMNNQNRKAVSNGLNNNGNNQNIMASSGINSRFVLQCNGMNSNYMANQSNGINNRMPVNYNGLNNNYNNYNNNMTVQNNGTNGLNGNQPTNYAFNCLPCNASNQNMFWCTMQK